MYHEAKGFIIFKSPGFLEIQLANDGADMMGGFGGVVLGREGNSSIWVVYIASEVQKL